MTMHRRVVGAVVDFSARYPLAIVLSAFAMIAALGAYAQRLELRLDLLELLPRDSPGFRAFEHQLGRVGGGSTLIVIASSPDRSANERLIDDLALKLDELAKTEPRIAYVESGTKDVRAFYEANKWLYADLADLAKADADLDRQVAIRSGLVEDLESDDASAAPSQGRALGLDDAMKRWDERSASRDAFPTGYFATSDGRLVGLRVVANTTLGDARGDALLAEVEHAVRELDPARRYDASMRVGFTGDIASAAGEKRALVSDAAWATGLALAIIVAALVLYYRSLWALAVIALPVALGIAAAYAFAECVFGSINTSGAFLGAIILGNGINYPIVLLSRYQEFCARGMAPDVARREAVLNAMRAELVGACVAAIAYGSLIVTRFRGFSQFGAIGFVGILAVWASIVPLVPAMLVLVERVRARLPPALVRWTHREPRLAADGGRRGLPALLARVTARHRWIFVATGLVVTVAAASKIPSYLRDPWEYDFGKLGSRSSEKSGAGEWSNKANDVFGGKMNIAGALMLADTPEQVPLLKKQMLENDARDPHGPLLAEIATVDDLLPGTAEEQGAKLDVLASIRARLTPRVLDGLSEDERSAVARARPPETLHVIAPEDLPPLLRRRFTENDGRIGTVFYVKPRNDVVFADGHNHLRLAKTTDNVRLPDGTVVMTASRSTIFAEMLESMRRDGPLASFVAFGAVVLVVAFAARSARVTVSVLVALVVGVTWLVGFAACLGIRIHYLNFVAFPITLGIGCEYPFNIADRVRLLVGDVAAAVRRSSGAVMLCSFTTIVGYGSLLLSDFQALESFGKLAVAGEVACVFTAVVLLPALLATGRPPAPLENEH